LNPKGSSPLKFARLLIQHNSIHMASSHASENTNLEGMPLFQISHEHLQFHYLSFSITSSPSYQCTLPLYTQKNKNKNICFNLFFISLTRCMINRYLSVQKSFYILSTKIYVFAGVAGGVGENPIPLQENILQKHAAFFDKNHDGVIYPWETFQGFLCFSFPFN